MKLYAPSYYQKFQCIADKCEHSCCIGWEIDVDNNTLDRYKKLSHHYGTVILSSIAAKDTPHFILDHGERCPHLADNGLCQIILNVGEDYLCDICREHPRFYNYTNAVEVGLGMSCREAARIILNSPDYAVIEHIGEVDIQTDNVPFDGRIPRSAVYTILQDSTQEYEARLEVIYREYAFELGDDEQWLQKLNALEYLDEAHRALFMKYSSAHHTNPWAEKYLERFLAYLIYRHCTEAMDESDFGSRMAFCLFGERFLNSLICATEANSSDAIAVLASIISEEIEYSDENTWALMA